jgi:hypothetical protein
LSKIKDFIFARKAEINEQIRLLKQELNEIKIIENTLAASLEVNSGQPVKAQRFEDTEKQGLTIKERILAILKDNPDGMTSSKLLEEINSRYQEEIPRWSLSPQLSRLKQENRISVDGKKWKIPMSYEQIIETSPPVIKGMFE